MLRFLLFMLLVLTATGASAFEYGSPVNYEIMLAGNFGEPRPNHFHGGIDIKTDGVEGKPIFSIGDGYVSQVSIGVAGFGNAVYVHHPEGYTSVYCHLKKFTPQIQAMVRKWQYAHHRAEGVMEFRPTDLPVAQGQLIAVSGNTGSSQAPHLHLEIHDSRTWDMVDPLNFLGHLLADTTPPTAHAFMAQPLKGEGVFCGSENKQTFGFTQHRLSREFTAWGKVGFALWANDYMEQTYNHYGIRKTQLFVDNRLVFESDVNNIPVAQNLQVNTWGDYEHYLRSHVWYMRSFVLPGVTLPMLHDEGGIINFCEKRDYHLTYVLSDFKGNESRYEFTVKGTPAQLVKNTPANTETMRRSFFTLAWNRTNNIQLPGLQLVVKPTTMAGTKVLQPHIKHLAGALSNEYQLSSTSFPLYNCAPVSIQLKHSVPDSTKLYVEMAWGNKRYAGGTCSSGGWITGQVRDLGIPLRLAYDNVSPSIRPVGENNWTASRQLRLSINDSESGIDHYEAYADGTFLLLEPVAKSNMVVCRLVDSPLKPTHTSHSLRVVATDKRNNRSEYHTQFIY